MRRVYARFMALSDDLERIAAVAFSFAEPGDELVGVLPVEPDGTRLYLCAFAAAGARSWVVLDDDGRAVARRTTVRDAVSIAAMCELAEETAAGGDLDELRAQLVALRITENPPGVDEAEQAVAALQEAVGVQPRVASPAYLDSIGAATRRLEHALDETAASSPFAEAMRAGMAAVESLASEVEQSYKRPLE